VPVSISIITAVFNRAGTIADALRSVAQQTHGNVEHIIVDGASNDGTLGEVMRCRNDRMRIISEPDKGIYDAVNKGIRAASGEVVGVVHSDDWLAHSRVLETIAHTFAVNPAIDGVYGDLQYVSSRNPDKVIRHWRAGTYHPLQLKQGWMPPHPTLYLRRSVFDRYGLYNTALQISADYDAILRFLTQGHIGLAYLPEVLVRMRAGGISNRSLCRIIQKSREDLYALRANGVGGLSTLAAKNFGKLGQFITKETQAP